MANPELEPGHDLAQRGARLVGSMRELATRLCVFLGESGNDTKRAAVGSATAQTGEVMPMRSTGPIPDFSQSIRYVVENGPAYTDRGPEQSS